MKHNNIDIVRTVDEMIERLNSQCKEANIEKNYSISIKTKEQSFESNANNQKKGGTRKVKVLNLYLNDLVTGERLLLYDNTFIPKNPSTLLTTNYKVLLYREMFYSMFAFSCVNFESLKREQATNKAIEHATKINSI